MIGSHSAGPLPQALRLDGESIAAFYQPIIALDTRRIEGYEVLGRAVGKESLRSLGPFFGDGSIPMEDHLLVDRLLREQAIAKHALVRNPPLLFLNLKPAWIYQQGQTGELFTLDLLSRYNADPSRIVIEITEESFQGSMDVLRSVIDRYRSQGCLIAIDDVGSGFSSADRIAQIQPNLLKIDMHMVKRSATHNGYYGVLRSFSELAEQIGASLLFEGVETTEDLERAIRSGARYVQGYLFARAGADFLEASSFAPVIENELDRHLKRFAMTERRWQQQAERLAEQLQAIVRDAETPEAADEWLESLLPNLGPECSKVYICNEEGIQLSANFGRAENGGWQREEEYRHANWSWRPYFVPNLVQLNDSRRAIVSRSYTDLDSRAWIRTISVLVRPGLILFADSKDEESPGLED
ncbi:EAL domain-containing protein [Paenibacillus sp. LHD-117]|uniref:EAL domain-containing protein n=1 Tax=Paenibacillus sp. LHD-117 TaxID=3071412 RepID=UPI0027E0FE70|nr:EAL domain-containing protein [Paenibacillus sp. LHD-117]MDQ6422226.1 EAL domain-containing protein [Paenibacillus sp. LHD-117]